MLKSLRKASPASRQRIIEAAKRLDALVDELRSEEIFRETRKIELMRLKKEFNEELMRQAKLSEEQKMQELFVKKNN